MNFVFLRNIIFNTNIIFYTIFVYLKDYFSVRRELPKSSKCFFKKKVKKQLFASNKISKSLAKLA